MTDDAPLTDDELAALERAGWVLEIQIGLGLLRFRRGAQTQQQTRAEWRAEIIKLRQGEIKTISIYDLGSGAIGILEDQIRALNAELAAARAVVEVARKWNGVPAMRAVIDAYDQAMKDGKP